MASTISHVKLKGIYPANDYFHKLKIQIIVLSTLVLTRTVQYLAVKLLESISPGVNLSYNFFTGISPVEAKEASEIRFLK